MGTTHSPKFNSSKECTILIGVSAKGAVMGVRHDQDWNLDECLYQKRIIIAESVDGLYLMTGLRATLHIRPDSGATLGLHSTRIPTTVLDFRGKL